MAGSPQLKIYRNGEYVGALKYYEDAAMLVANGGEVRYGHQVKYRIWEDTEANAALAANSYDEAADIMRSRVQQMQQEAYDRVYGRAS